MKRSWICLLLACVFCASSVWAQECAPPQANWQNVSLSDDSLLIIALKVNNIVVSRSMEVHQYQGRLMLPAGLLKDALGLSIATETKDNKFTIEVAEGCEHRVRFGLKSGISGEAPWFYAQDKFDLYLDKLAWEHWLAADIDFDYSQQLLEIKSDKLLANLLAYRKRQNQGVRNTTFNPDLLVHDVFNRFTVPIANIDARYRWRQQEQRHRFDGRMNTFFDLFHQSVDLRLESNGGRERSLLKFTREFKQQPQPGRQKDFTGYYEVGDVFTTRDNLLHRGNTGAGVYWANRRPDELTPFANTTLEVESFPGWRAELYRDGLFLDEATADSNRIIFNDVLTTIGINNFEIRLFGPQGQRDVRFRTVNVGQQQANKGRWFTEAYFLKPDERVFGSDGEDSNVQTSAKVLAGYGLSENFTLAASAHRIDFEDERRNYATAYLYSTFGNHFIDTNVAVDDAGGTAAFFGYRGQFDGGERVNFDYSWYNDLVSEVNPQELGFRQEARLAVTGQQVLGRALNWGANVRWNQFEGDGGGQLNARFRATKSFGNHLFSASVAIDNQDYWDGAQFDMFWVQRFGELQWTNSTQFRGVQEAQVRRVSSELLWRKGQLQHLFRANYDPEALDRWRGQYSLNWQRPEYNVSTGVEWAEDNGWQVQLGINLTLGFDEIQQRPYSYRTNNLDTGRILATAFADNDFDNMISHGDELLPRVGFAGNQNWRGRQTNAFGQTILPTARARGNQALVVDESLVASPFLKPVYKRAAIDSHPGGMVRVDVPFQYLNDVEGSIFRTNGDESRPLANATVRLLQRGRHIAETRAEFDGFYLFSGIRPGYYELRVLEGALRDSAPKVLATRRVNASIRGDAVLVDDILIPALGSASPRDNAPVRATASKTAAVAVAADAQTPKKGEAARYAIQLGAFAKMTSLLTMKAKVPASMSTFIGVKGPLHVLYVGEFDRRINAQNALAKLQPLSGFSDAFVVSQWTVAVPQADPIGPDSGAALLHNTLNAGLHALQTVPPLTRICQLASYGQVASLQGLSLDNSWLVKRFVNGRTLYTLWRTMADGQSCVTTNQQPGLLVMPGQLLETAAIPRDQ